MQLQYYTPPGFPSTYSFVSDGHHYSIGSIGPDYSGLSSEQVQSIVNDVKKAVSNASTLDWCYCGGAACLRINDEQKDSIPQVINQLLKRVSFHPFDRTGRSTLMKGQIYKV